VAGFVLSLRVFALGAKPLITLFSRSHGLVVRRFGANRGKREETLQVLARALRTSGIFSASYESLELVAAGVTTEIEEGHFLGNDGTTQLRKRTRRGATSLAAASC
jgi:hypothetical protein